MESIVLGGGCFWCLDASFRLIRGVEEVESGYAGGSAETADYHSVSSGTTGHAEVVRVTFNPKIISLADILDIFWVVHDPTTLHRQGNDVGTQYRSVIFYLDDNQKRIATESIRTIQKVWDSPVVTELQPLTAFYSAEEYHQDYFNKNPDQGYCQVIINPKLQKLRKKFAARMIN
jgi:peptide-methionine (S)-S-oxide reductase